MSYTPRVWQSRELITAEKLNNLENGVSANDALAGITAEKLGFSVLYNNLLAIGDILEGKALTAASNGYTPTNSPGNNTSDYIPVKAGETLIGFAFRRFWFYKTDEEQNIVPLSLDYSHNLAGDPYGTELIEDSGIRSFEVPETAEYIRFTYKNDLSDGIPMLYRLQPIERHILDRIGGINVDAVKYYALGDSITEGMYANKGSASSVSKTKYGYPYWIALQNNYTLVNLGQGGGGWRNQSTDEHQSAVDVVDDEVNDFSDADIITLAYGVNDWKSGSNNTLGDIASAASGDGTVIGAMMYVVEKLITVAPAAQIIVLLPINYKRATSVVSPTLENDWAFGTAHNGNTLADYRAAIKACAEHYHLRVVDPDAVSPLNRLNMDEFLGDGAHPTKEFYKRMGCALAPYIK